MEHQVSPSPSSPLLLMFSTENQPRQEPASSRKVIRDKREVSTPLLGGHGSQQLSYCLVTDDAPPLTVGAGTPFLTLHLAHHLPHDGASSSDFPDENKLRPEVHSSCSSRRGTEESKEMMVFPVPVEEVGKGPSLKRLLQAWERANPARLRGADSRLVRHVVGDSTGTQQALCVMSWNGDDVVVDPMTRGKQQQQRFDYISLDLDEEASEHLQQRSQVPLLAGEEALLPGRASRPQGSVESLDPSRRGCHAEDGGVSSPRLGRSSSLRTAVALARQPTAIPTPPLSSASNACIPGHASACSGLPGASSRRPSRFFADRGNSGTMSNADHHYLRTRARCTPQGNEGTSGVSFSPARKVAKSLRRSGAPGGLKAHRYRIAAKRAVGGEVVSFSERSLPKSIPLRGFDEPLNSGVKANGDGHRGRTSSMARALGELATQTVSGGPMEGVGCRPARWSLISSLPPGRPSRFLPCSGENRGGHPCGTAIDEERKGALAERSADEIFASILATWRSGSRLVVSWPKRPRRRRSKADKPTDSLGGRVPPGASSAPPEATRACAPASPQEAGIPYRKPLTGGIPPSAGIVPGAGDAGSRWPGDSVAPAETSPAVANERDMPPRKKSSCLRPDTVELSRRPKDPGVAACSSGEGTAEAISSACGTSPDSAMQTVPEDSPMRLPRTRVDEGVVRDSGPVQRAGEASASSGSGSPMDLQIPVEVDENSAVKERLPSTLPRGDVLALCPKETTGAPLGQQDADDRSISACTTGRQKDMLALLRAGEAEGAFFLAQGAKTNASMFKGPRTPPWWDASDTLFAGARQSTTNADDRVERGTAIRLHIIISDDLFDASGSLVEAMRVFQGHDPSPEQPPTTRSWSTRRSARAPTNPDCSPVRVALLELGVQPPVNLIVGESRAPTTLHSWSAVLRGGTMTRGQQVDRAFAGGAATRGGGEKTRAHVVLDKLEQWLVGYPCRVYLRYSYSDAELAELVVHAASAEQGCKEDFLPPVAASSPNGSRRCRLEKRRRSDGVSASPRGFSSGAATSPLAPVEERSRDNPDWAMVHARQAWFLQLFPTINAYSASALLSAVSLKHLLVAPYEELAHLFLGKSTHGRHGVRERHVGAGDRGGLAGSAARGGVSAEALRDFCQAIRYEGVPGDGRL